MAAAITWRFAKGLHFKTAQLLSRYDGFFRCPSRFLFEAGENTVDYAVPLDPALVEQTRRMAGEQIPPLEE